MPPRRYQALGAALIAGAVTARYVAKWRRHRTRRESERRALGVTGGRWFIGIDLADPTVESPKPATVAVLSPELECSFGTWEYAEDGRGIVPQAVLGKPFMIAIDGPQGLAADPDATARVSERLVNAPGRTLHTMPEGGRPYDGLISGAVRLFYALVRSGSRFRLLGLDDVPMREANLMEVYPHGGWSSLTDSALPQKRTVAGRQQRLALLTEQGVRIHDDPLPTDDQLDAAMAAWTAYCLYEGRAKLEGDAPMLDPETGVVREGYIVQPRVHDPVEEVADAPIAPV